MTDTSLSRTLAVPFFGNSAPGVCVRDKEQRVLFQNAECRAVCGPRAGQRCEQACVFAALGHDGPGQATATARPLHGTRCDLWVHETADGSVTVLQPLTTHASHAEFFAEHRLTGKECEVASRMLLGLTNRQIAGELSITRGTVRTHVNRVHQKLPEGWLHDRRTRQDR